ncbi:hypothetical protein LTR84_002933 [Exophiala bonariae]|uniref:Uncharacterized protein n=1 Tax=Exophiala bonariae TaxID=1690606 RepID=A0AAV9NAF8_9EURO|nr:hypothetical protein LTR84_002933 [Exophiala bonariae]
MSQSSFVPSLVWVDGDQTQSSKANIRSHIVREGYRKKKLQRRARLSTVTTQEEVLLPGEGSKASDFNSQVFKPVETYPLPAWVSFKLQDSLSTYQRDLFNCLPLRLDPVGQSELYRQMFNGFTVATKRYNNYRYRFTKKYGCDPWQLTAELAFQEPLAFRVLAAYAIRAAAAIRMGKGRICSADTDELELVTLHADIIGTIVKRLKSPERQPEEILNALLSLIARTATANLPAWKKTYASHFRGFRSLFFLRPNPWQIESRAFELRLIIFETCYSDGCWSFVCPPADFSTRLSEFTKSMESLEIFVVMRSRSDKISGKGDRAPTSSQQYGRINRNSLIFRFLSKDVPMVRVVNGFHDESLAQMSVLLLLAMTLLEYSGDRRRTKAFLTYLESEVRDRGLEYNESQWCLFWVMFLTRDPPIYTYSQERVWKVLRYMNVVKAISVSQRARLKAFLLHAIGAEAENETSGSFEAMSAAANFDIQSLVAELQAGPFACHMCGSSAIFEGAHLHDSVCNDPYCHSCPCPGKRKAAHSNSNQAKL